MLIGRIIIRSFENFSNIISGKTLSTKSSNPGFFIFTHNSKQAFKRAFACNIIFVPIFVLTIIFQMQILFSLLLPKSWSLLVLCPGLKRFSSIHRCKFFDFWLSSLFWDHKITQFLRKYPEICFEMLVFCFKCLRLSLIDRRKTLSV